MSEKRHGFGILQENGLVKLVGLIMVEDEGHLTQSRFSGEMTPDEAHQLGYRFERNLAVGENVRIAGYAPPPPPEPEKAERPAWMDMLPPGAKPK